MPRANGLQRVNEHGPGHPLAWIIWSVPAFFFLYEYILRILPGIIERDLEKEFALDQSQIGAGLGMYYFAYAPMQLVVGILLDRYGARVLLAGAAVICAIGMVVFPMSSTEFGLAGSRFLVGLGSSFAFIGAIYVAMVWFPTHQVPLLTGLTAGLGFGIGIVGELFTSELLGSPPAWRQASLVLSIVGMLIAVMVLVVVPHRPAWFLDRTGIEEGRTMKQALMGLLKVMARPKIWLISLGCALLYLPLPLAANWGPRTIGEVIGRSEAHSSQLFAWFYLGIAIGCPIAGWLDGRFGRARPILMLGAVGACAVVVVLALLGTPTEQTVGLLLLALGLTTSAYVLGYPLAAELSPEDAHGSAIAFVNFVAMMIAFGFVWLYGVAVDAFASTRGHLPDPDPGDFQSTLLWTGVLIGVSMACFLLIGSARRARS